LKTSDIFKVELADYAIDPVANYRRYAEKQISVLTGESPEKVIDIVNKTIGSAGIVNPEIRYFQKDDKTLDTFEKRSDLNSFLTSFHKDRSDEILIPTFTTTSKKEDSLLSGFININLAKRKKDKAIAKEAELVGDEEKATKFNTSQLYWKLTNNSMSGAFASPGTVFTNRSGHNALTSITRAVSSIGNALSESLVAGNHMVFNEEDCIDHMTTILLYVDQDKVKKTCTKFGLKLLTKKDIIGMYMMPLSTVTRNPIPKGGILERFVDGLSPLELTTIGYTNNIKNIFFINPLFGKRWLKNAISRTIKPGVNYLKVLTTSPEWATNLTHIICADQIKGMFVEYDKLDDILLSELGSVCHNVIEEFKHVADIFHTFLLTDVMPPNLVDMKNFTRRTIVLSDTDSTCASYNEWGDYVIGGKGLTPEKISIAGVVVTILSETLSHYLDLLCVHMNIPKEKFGILAMKSEFIWTAFNLSSKSKHYFANTIFREGGVFDKPVLEVKGSNLKSSAVPPAFINMAVYMQEEINRKITNNEKLVLEEYLLKLDAMERFTISIISNGEPGLFKRGMMKDAGSYKSEGHKSPYFSHMVWEEVFEDKYTTNMKPPYYFFDIPIKKANKTEFKETLSNFNNEDMSCKLEALLNKYKKEAIGSIKVPVAAMSQYGIPTELLPSIDFRKLLNIILGPVYVTLGSLGIYQPKNLFIKDIYTPLLLEEGEVNPYDNEWVRSIMVGKD